MYFYNSEFIVVHERLITKFSFTLQEGDNIAKSLRICFLGCLGSLEAEAFKWSWRNENLSEILPRFRGNLSISKHSF